MGKCNSKETPEEYENPENPTPEESETPELFEIETRFICIYDVDIDYLRYETNNYTIHDFPDFVYLKVMTKIKYDYNKIKEIFEELNKKYTREFWHPSRINKWIWIID
jgi:hypothetical protein